VVALAPAVLAGLLFFGLPALKMLAVALLVGGAAHLAARLGKQPLIMTPVVPALIGVALVGPGASLLWPAGIALVASGLELARARFAPGARLEFGLLTYSTLFLASKAAPGVYFNPQTSTAAPEPIHLWLQYYGAGQLPIDPVKLYVCNVPGPFFATSLLAVALGAAWLWYARRLSLLVVLTFGLGALTSVKLMGWSATYHLVSGPLWFCAALILADRRMLPSSGLGRPLLGLTAGVVVMAARVRGYAIESVPIAIAGLQLVVALVEGIGWLIPNRGRVRAAARAPGLATRFGGKARAS
jgi:NQR2, RnfD, RnfE family